MLDSLADKLERTKAAVFVNFSSIPVKELDLLRRQCREQGIDYVVAKKTLLKRVLADKGYQVSGEVPGEIAAMFGYADEVAPSKLASVFAKDHPNLKLVGGVMSGALMSAEQVTALAKLPSKQELIGQVVGTIAAPLTGLVNVLQGNLRSLVYVLQAMADKPQQ